MKKVFVGLLMVLFGWIQAQAQSVLAAWDFYGLPATPNPAIATAVVYSVSAAPLLSKAGLGTSGSTNSFLGGQMTNSSLNEAQYFAFNLSNSAPITVTDLSMCLMRFSQSAPTNFTLRVSNNPNFNTYKARQYKFVGATRLPVKASDLNVTGTSVYFRIYGYGNPDTNAAVAGFSGTTNSVTTINSGLDGTLWDLIVYGYKGALSVMPSEKASFRKSLDGSFAPVSQVYTVSNPASASFDWTVIHTQSWATVTLSGGTLSAGESSDVGVSINSAAEALPMGVYTDTLVFSNLLDSTVQTRPIELVVVGMTNITIAGASRLLPYSNNPYTCQAQCSDGTSSNVTGLAEWSLIGNGAMLSGNVLSAGNIVADSTVTLQAVYGGVTNTCSVTLSAIPSGVLAAWDFYGLPATPIPVARTASVYTVNSAPVLSRIGLGRAGSADSFMAYQFPTNSTLTDAVNSGKYFTFTLSDQTPFTVDNILICLKRGNGGDLAPTGFALRVSSDVGFSTYTEQHFVTDVSSQTFHVLAASNLNVTGTAVYFRLYGYGNNVTTNNAFIGFAGTTNSPINSGLDGTVYDLIVYGYKGSLSVTPYEKASFRKFLDEPITPASQVYTVSNSVGAAFDWVATHTQSWVTVTSSGGTLSAGESSDVGVSISSAADALPIGVYTDTLVFSNSSESIVATRSIEFMVVGATNIIVEGPAGLIEHSTNFYTCWVQYSDGSVSNVTDSMPGCWSLVGEAGATMNGNALSIGDIVSNGTVTIQAVYGGFTNTYSVFIAPGLTLLGIHPVAGRSAHKNIHIIHPWGGQLYMGVGNWNDYPGPIPIVSYDPKVNRFIVKHYAGGDSIGVFRDIGNALYVPSIDPCFFRETTDFCFYDGTIWTDETSLGFLHLFDIATLTGSDLWAVGSKMALEDAPGGSSVSCSLDGGKTWADFTPGNSYSRYYWMFPFNGKMYIQGQFFDGSAWQPSSLTYTYFNKATAVNGADGEAVIGRTAGAPGMIPPSANFVLFDGSTSRTILSSTYDFAVVSNRVYALQSAGSLRQVKVCEDVTVPAPVWTSLEFNFPSNSSSIAVMSNVLYIGTASAELYATSLPGSEDVLEPVSLPLVVEQDDLFGAALAADGNWLLSGAPHEAVDFPENGVVYVFKDPSAAGDWQFHSKLLPPEVNRTDGRFFGNSVAISSNLMAVAETGTPSTGPNRGELSRVYVYMLETNSWGLVQTITNSYIQSISLKGNWLVLGRKDNAEIRKWDGDSFEATQTISFSSLNSTTFWFPLTQAVITSNRLFVGISGDITYSGAGEIWDYINNGDVWTYRTNYSTKINGIYPPDGFSRSMSADRDFLVVGAPRDDEAAVQAGAVYIINLSTSAKTKILPPALAYNLGFGASVHIDGNDLFVGALRALGSSGGGAVYHYYFAGGSWHYYGLIEANTNGWQNFGAALTAGNSELVVGASQVPLNDQLLSRVVIYPYENNDSDGDGIADRWENLYFGGLTNANPNVICSNGVNTLRQAYIAGLNPKDHQSVLQTSFLRSPSSEKVLCWSGAPGRIYSVYWTTNLLAGFQCLESNIPWTQTSFTNAPAVPFGYYKINVRLAE